MRRKVLHDLPEHDKEKVKHCALLWAPFDCLFVHSIYIPSIQSSHSSHSPIGDSTSVWIHSSPCLCSFLIKLPTGLSNQGDKTAKETRTHEVFMLPTRQKNTYGSCGDCTLSCLSIQIVLLIHKVYISLMGSSEGSCFTLRVQSLHSLIQANYRNRPANFKCLPQTIDHFIRLFNV